MSQSARYGIQDICVSVNGDQFNCEEFRKFAKDWEFRHKTLSPTFANNGKIEHVVIVKSLMRNARHSRSDPYLAILDFRNTPSQ
jgi:hypothetical protein